MLPAVAAYAVYRGVRMVVITHTEYLAATVCILYTVADLVIGLAGYLGG